MKQESANVKEELGHVEESHAEMAFAKVMAEFSLQEREAECDDLKAKMSKLENASTEKDRECENLKEQISKLEDALKKKDRDCEVFKVKKEAAIIQLNEMLIACKNECYEMNEKVLRFEEEQKMLLDREARGEERFKKLLEDGKSAREKGAELERARQKAEVLVELYKQRDIRMGTRVTQLENDVAILLIDHTTTVVGSPPFVDVVQISDNDEEDKRDSTFTAALKRKRLEDSHGDICSTSASTVPRF